jgi:hypothetical protein
MNIDSIKNGLVIDHITAGKAMRIYDMLHLGELDCQVAIIKNAHSTKMGKKDIIKIDSAIDIDLDVLGYMSPHITVDVIRDGQRVEKKHIPSCPRRSRTSCAARIRAASPRPSRRSRTSSAWRTPKSASTAASTATPRPAICKPRLDTRARPL